MPLVNREIAGMMESHVGSLSMAEFARSFTMRGRTLAWLLGAGASAAAGVPTAYDMIIDFKTRLFCSAVKIPRREIDPGDPLWFERITSFFDGAHGLPPSGDPDEYAAAFEAVFPLATERRAYIEAAVSRAEPSFGHRVLASLISNGQAPCVFTTNFDPLIERTTVSTDEVLLPTDRSHLTVGALDSSERAERCLRESAWPLLVKMHGDYHSERLMNTATELQEQDERLRQVLVEACGRFGLIVVGYSGRDASVMRALMEALNQQTPFPGGIYWMIRPGGRLLPGVEDFLASASAKSVQVHLVETETFDELAGELDRQVSLPTPLAEYVRAARTDARVRQVALPTVEAANFPVLRCSALLLTEIPTQARRLVLDRPSTTLEVRNLLREARVRGAAACIGMEVAAFGRDAELVAALGSLGARVDGLISLNPKTDSWAVGLLYDALVRALARRRPLRSILRRSGHSLVVVPPDASRTDDTAVQLRQQLQALSAAYAESLVGTVSKLQFPFAEAVRVRLEAWLDRSWCVFDPFTWVDLPREVGRGSGEPGTGQSPAFAPGDPAGDWRRERWARRYNPKWANILDAWTRVLVPEDQTSAKAIGCLEDEGADGVFVLSAATAWSRPVHVAVMAKQGRGT